MKTQSVALVARILVKTQPFRTTGEKGSMKTQSIALVARILVKTQPIRTTGEKGSMKTQPCHKPGKKALEKHSIVCN